MFERKQRGAFVLKEAQKRINPRYSGQLNLYPKSQG